jgi:hypothetical protein
MSARPAITVQHRITITLTRAGFGVQRFYRLVTAARMAICRLSHAGASPGLVEPKAHRISDIAVRRAKALSATLQVVFAAAG